MTSRIADRAALDALFEILKKRGYAVIGPTVRDQAVVYGRISSIAHLPEGWTDEQDGGHYRLIPRDDNALFGFNLGQTSWKQFLFPPRTELVRISRQDGSLAFQQPEREPQKMAFVGVRACELAAIGIQDKVFLGSGHVDPTYAAGRDGLFVVAVNCGTAGGTCFCVSMGTGPECRTGFDLVLTEIEPGTRYVLKAGTEAGDAVLDDLGGEPPSPGDRRRVEEVVSATAEMMGRSMETDGIHDLLVENPNHPRWEDVAQRCLTCGNCTLACPTCFCSTTTDSVNLDGEAVRTRKWDSCFGLEFSGLHGHPVRGTNKGRYRQWMTHKLATWHDQFGSSGCVGCGRCITWCPVGIDITEEVAAMRATVEP